MHIGYIDFHCDSEMCWVKDAERDGWLHLSPWVVGNMGSAEILDHGAAPRCANYPDQSWDDVDLNC